MYFSHCRLEATTACSVLVRERNKGMDAKAWATMEATLAVGPVLALGWW
jgi:hypothetical protein